MRLEAFTHMSHVELQDCARTARISSASQKNQKRLRAFEHQSCVAFDSNFSSILLSTFHRPSLHCRVDSHFTKLYLNAHPTQPVNLISQCPTSRSLPPPSPTRPPLQSRTTRPSSKPQTPIRLPSSLPHPPLRKMQSWPRPRPRRRTR